MFVEAGADGGTGAGAIKMVVVMEERQCVRTVGTLFDRFAPIFMLYGHRVRYLFW